jgi:peptide/nickel transport system substrate-binding protein
MRLRVLVAVVAALVLGWSGGPAAAQGNILRFANSGDFLSMDQHFSGDAFAVGILLDVNEPLVARNPQGRLEPALAAEWERVSPTVWRFKLRANVRFHEGQPFTADDVVFSLARARHENSTYRPYLSHITDIRRIDDLTVEVVTRYPDPILLDKLRTVGIFSRAWADAHGAQNPASRAAASENYATRHANGTGPFILREWEPGVRATFAANPAWWGRPQHNLAGATFTRIANDATRTAALLAGDIDFAYAVPTQDIQRLQGTQGIRVVSEPEIRVIYLYMDMARDALLGSNVTDRNPFKDVRVRRAVYQAIDVDAIIAKVLRGQARPTGSHLSARVDGHLPELEKRLPFDPAAARKLLAEAGYADGFAVTLDCVNVTFRAAVCQAIASMLAQVNIRVTFQPSPSALFFPKLTQATTSFFEVGWTPGTDPWTMLNATVRTYDGAGAGAFNAGRYSNPKLDALIDAIRVEPDLGKRRALTGDALRLMHAELPLVPLYRRTLTWVMRPNVHVAPLPNDVLELRWVRID